MNKRTIKVAISLFCQNVVHFFFKQHNRICFESFDGRQYSDNPRAISEHLHELDPSIGIVWLLKHEDNYGIVPQYVKVIDNKLLFYMYVATSKGLVKNTPYETGIKKFENQIFVQTWHGDRGFKKVLYGISEHRNVPIIDNDVVDYAIAGSSYGEKLYRTSFHYYGKVICEGCPRNEALLGITSDEKDLIKLRLGINKYFRVLLYAPTFRDNDNEQKTFVDLEDILNQIGNQWVVLIRGHVNKKISYSGKNNKQILDVTDYPDMKDILGITDLLITDYSSSAQDFILTNKPVIIAQFDIKEYTDSCREFNISPEKAGFIVANNQKELVDKIIHTNKEEYLCAYESINAIYGTKEFGTATDTICKYLLK